jgi:hypothetical protein
LGLKLNSSTWYANLTVRAAPRRTSTNDMKSLGRKLYTRSPNQERCAASACVGVWFSQSLSFARCEMS